VPRETTVVTPENIPLTLELAGLGSRFGALMVDLLAQSLVLVALAVLAGVLGATTGLRAVLGDWLTTISILGTFFVLFGYFILFETVWNGQTPGKKTFGLRVVRDGGYPVNFFAAAARNLVRIADFVPVFYGVGGLVVFFQPQYKRLGDLAAGTLVVKERGAATALDFATYGPMKTPDAPPPELPEGVRHPADALTGDELGLLRRFTVRRGQMNPDDAERLAYRMVVPLVTRLGLHFAPGAPPPRYADLIGALVRAADARDEPFV
jgi:uncharacterized RDD family membrane protein YckC